jgi:lipoprotein-anchoring transpeptidase ErfK/SrfK
MLRSGIEAKMKYGILVWCLCVALILAANHGAVAQEVHGGSEFVPPTGVHADRRGASVPPLVKPAISAQRRINLAWQIALANHNFSPGILDGIFGPWSRMALRQYARYKLPGLNPFSKKGADIVYKALGVDPAHAIVTYTVSRQDLQAVGNMPIHWRAMAAAKRMPYSSTLDCLAEKFHCTRALIETLNPGVNLRAVVLGQKINVPDISPFPGPNDFGLPGALSSTIRKDRAFFPYHHLAYIEIDLQKRIMRLFNDKNQQFGLFHCSVAALKSDLPTTDAYVKDFALNPNYTFLPASWPTVHDIHHPLVVPPGPRNPVGVVWMGLNLKNVGMHGNPLPQFIGLTGSHGCFRMTNWDAVHLFTLVHIGLPIIMINHKHPIPLDVPLPPGCHPPGLPKVSDNEGQVVLASRSPPAEVASQPAAASSHRTSSTPILSRRVAEESLEAHWNRPLPDAQSN